MSRYGSDYHRRSDYDSDEERMATSSARETRESTPRNGVVKGTHYLRLREAPGEDERTLKIVKEGTKVEIVNSIGGLAPRGFLKVKLPNDKTEYWAKSEFIR